MATNIWNTYGIRTSPFFQEALDLSKRSLRPIDLFVGRSGETDEILRRILGSDSSRIVVAGAAGVGKTTFIQHVKYVLAAEHAYAVSSEFCRVPHDLSATSLGVEVLRSVLRSLRTVLPEGRLEGLEGFELSRRIVEETERLSMQWSIPVLGGGGGLGGDRRIDRPVYGPSQFLDALTALIRSALSEGVTGVVVHLNNLENLDSDPEAAAFLLRDARDYFLVPGLHLLLGATEAFHISVLSAYSQVRSIFPTPSWLEPLAFEDVRQCRDPRNPAS